MSESNENVIDIDTARKEVANIKDRIKKFAKKHENVLIAVSVAATFVGTVYVTRQGMQMYYQNSIGFHTLRNVYEGGTVTYNHPEEETLLVVSMAGETPKDGIKIERPDKPELQKK